MPHSKPYYPGPVCDMPGARRPTPNYVTRAKKYRSMPGHGLNLKNIKLNPDSGSVSQTPAKRGKSEAKSEYERVRIREIERRAELYELRVERLKAGLLDRAELERAYVAITSAIRTVIAQSKLSKTEKADALANLVTVAQFIESVTKRQTADSARDDQSTVANANNGIDQEL